MNYNQFLIENNKVPKENIEMMDKLYPKLDELIQESKQTDSIERVQEIVQEVEEIEFMLQRLWNFEEDSNYHKYWLEVGNCSCPRDNLDILYFGRGRIINKSCSVHGRMVKDVNESL